MTIDEELELRDDAARAAEEWDQEYKTAVVQEFMEKGFVFICPICAERIVYSASLISQMCSEVWGHRSEDFVKRAYWKRVGWCMGLGLEMSYGPSKCQQCHAEKKFP